VPKIFFITADGTPNSVDAAVGTSIMRAAVGAGIDGILAECGGNAMCATCHVYVAEADRLPPMSPVEDELLEATASERLADSRLSCQLLVTANLDGLSVVLPETQE
jgi:2Fe-2S ferredoxin